ncbi:hypothetical protein MHC_05730 [Mycoplasma haemocanis str. Illinois]|uniref:Uncharacterized protein n=1 Tax=Mycoplasma haemocanis (strain Illinois) TaxID=1111676 RepID=H6N8M7_MYCHN|nr:hypothetical protein [Mycoplasma haemocanis]AEW45999.1 hypothetical protein MHC_05730 [Mycoplasma haemocanis str. Illinois]
MEDNQTLEEIASQEQEFSQEDLEDDTSLVSCYTRCHKSMRRQLSMVKFWFLFLLLVIGGIVALYGTQTLNFSSKNHKEASITVIPFSVAVIMGIIFKILSISRQNKYFSTQSKFFFEKLPTESLDVIQEFYILQHCRKCSQYYITMTIVALCIITAVYTCISVGIMKAAGHAGPKLFEEYSGLSKSPLTWKVFFEDTTRAAVFGPLFSIPVWFLMYGIASVRTKNIICAMERLYSTDKIADKTLCAYRINESNRRQKIVCFGIVCLLGCVIYIFFKKLICTIFEKSFYT